MKILVDSNILLRLAHLADPQHQETKNAMAKLHQEKHLLCFVPQNIYEFWVVATRPVNVNGLNWSVGRVQNELVTARRLLTFLDETPAFFPEWEKLVSTHGVIGKTAHDARLVAAMIVHSITHLLTFNKQDFQRFANITAWTPADVLALP
jgi:predicted nucleic acid-binding protein